MLVGLSMSRPCGGQGQVVVLKCYNKNIILRLKSFQGQKRLFQGQVIIGKCQLPIQGHGYEEVNVK